MKAFIYASFVSLGLISNAYSNAGAQGSCQESKACMEAYQHYTKWHNLADKITSRNEPVNSAFFKKHTDLADEACKLEIEYNGFRKEYGLPLGNETDLDAFKGSILAILNQKILPKDAELIRAVFDDYNLCNTDGILAN